MRNQALAEKYPNLYISEDGRSVWVLRDGRDAESMGYSVNEADYPALNEKAGKANQPGWFYCSRCKTAKPETEFAYFYFAGKYCNACKESNLPHYNKAMSETYN